MQIPAEVQFAQRLAANEKSDRDKAVRKLKRWFHNRSAVGNVPFSEDELMRIWKGLFYCYWMSDKPLVQEELAVSIASMIENFANVESALLFIKTFLRTMGREWFGIDRWRMDKFMMMVRRFVRQIFKFNKKHNWDPKVTEQISNAFAEDLLLCDISKTSLGLQMHVTDVFLEELAKVGGEEIQPEIIDIYLEPFYKIVSDCKELRFRGHVKERIFNYLIRQSDCGIEWEAEKDIESLGNIELLENGDGEEDEGEHMENGENGVEKDDNSDMEEADESMTAEDPRAGEVDVEIPQLQVDYAKISEKLFTMGSDKKSNRGLLYALSKHFKDVSNNMFPLGDTPSDDEEVEKYSVKKEIVKLQKQEENIQKKKVKSKEEYKVWKKEQARLEKQAAMENGVDEGESAEEEEGDDLEEDFVDDDEDIGERKKRKLDDASEQDSPESKKAKMEENKLRKKELERKRKSEQKRRKRERLLAQKMEESEMRRKSEMMIDRDLHMKAVASEDTGKKKKKKEIEAKEAPVEAQLVNGDEPASDSSKVSKKKKKKKAKDIEKSEENQPTNEEPSTEEVKKNKKKDQEILEQENDDLNLAETEKSPKKSKKKKKKKDKQKDESLGQTDTSKVKTDISSQESPQKSENIVAMNGHAEVENEHITPSKKKKDKKKHSKEVENNDQSPTEKKKAEKEDNSVSSPKKKKFDNNTSITNNDSFTATKKKKKNKIVDEESSSSGKLFAEPTDWDTPLQPGEQEIVIPNKKYKGKQKLEPAAENPAETNDTAANGFQDFPSPTVSTPKVTHTAMFLKKAMSKSVTPKKKLSQIEKLKMKASSSESRVKRVNFALTKNTMQGIDDLNASIKSSPGIPHDPRKHPEKSLLKRNLEEGGREGSPQLNPVSLNTQLNSISKKGKKLMGKNKRMSAMEFF